MRMARKLGLGLLATLAATVASGAQDFEYVENDGGAFAFLREVERQAMDMGRVGRRSLQALPTLNLNRTDCGQPMRIDIRSQTEYHLYVDGAEVGYSNGMMTQSFVTRYGSSGPVTIAVEATRDIYATNFPTIGGLSINVTVCNQTVISDMDWVCTDTRPWSDKWALSSYTPRSFMQSWLVREDQRLFDGSSSFYLWSKSCAAAGAPETAYCRATFTPRCPATKSCYNAQTSTKIDTNCLSPCAEAVKSMDTCSTLAHVLTSSCSSCGVNAMKNMKSLCEEAGCSMEQCQGTASPARVPDTTCLSPCTSGMSSVKSECDRQSYMFQSGCSAGCGPAALAYARKECISKKGCAPTQCQVFNTTSLVSGNGSDSGSKPKPTYTPPPTPDLSCFIRCLGGMNGYSSYCDKINFALYSGCHNCPASIIEWAKSSCVSYVDEVTGVACTEKQCTNK